MKRYRVTLTDQERATLHTLIDAGTYKKTKRKRAQALLAADESQGGKKMTDREIMHAYDLSQRTVERLRQRFVEEGFEVALQGQKRAPRKDKRLDGKVEAHLVALRCSEPPLGYSKWTLRLLADQMVELGYVEHISHEGVRQMLKKTR